MKPDPAVEWVRPFNPSQIPQTRTRTALSPISCPLDIEIGCGVGWHPIAYARKHPNRYLVAIEHTAEKFEKFARRLRRNPAARNLLAVHANAISWITHEVTTQSVDRYFLLYPNPYPKAKQRNQRWHAMPFMERLIATLKPGGELILATNLPAYAEEAEDLLVQHWGLIPARKRLLMLPTLPEGFPRTHFEKKYLEAGQICFDLVFRKPTLIP